MDGSGSFFCPGVKDTLKDLKLNLRKTKNKITGSLRAIGFSVKNKTSFLSFIKLKYDEVPGCT